MKKRLIKECLRIAISKNTPYHHEEWGNFHHFAFIIQNNQIIEWSTNRRNPSINGKLLGYRDRTKGHAEYEAYRKARALLNKDVFDCINVRLNKHDDWRLSKPCKCCSNFLKSVGCSSVWFSTEIGFARLKL